MHCTTEVDLPKCRKKYNKSTTEVQPSKPGMKMQHRDIPCFLICLDPYGNAGINTILSQ